MFLCKPRSLFVARREKRFKGGDRKEKRDFSFGSVSCQMRSWIIIGNTSKKRCGYVVACGDEPAVAWTVA